MRGRNSYSGLRTFFPAANNVSNSARVSDWSAATCGVPHGPGDHSWPSGVSGYDERGGDCSRRTGAGNLSTTLPCMGESCKPRTSTPDTGLQDYTDLIRPRSAADHMTLNAETCSGRAVLGITLDIPFPYVEPACRIRKAWSVERYFLAHTPHPPAGVGAPHLITFYMVFIRPTLEYTAPAKVAPRTDSETLRRPGASDYLPTAQLQYSL